MAKSKKSLSLYETVLRKTVEDVHAALKNPANLEKVKGSYGDTGETLVHVAINGNFRRHGGKKETMKIIHALFSHDIDQNGKDGYGNNYLLHAVRSNSPKMAKYFFKNCDPMETNFYGLSFLHIASLRGYIETLEVLDSIDAGNSIRKIINYNTTKKFTRYIKSLKGNLIIEGWTALHFAAVECHFDCVQWLVQHKANVNIKTREGQTAADLLKRYSKSMEVEMQQRALQCIDLLEVQNIATAEPLNVESIKPHGAHEPQPERETSYSLPEVRSEESTEETDSAPPSKVPNDLEPLPLQDDKIIDGVLDYLAQHGYPKEDEIVKSMTESMKPDASIEHNQETEPEPTSNSVKPDVFAELNPQLKEFEERSAPGDSCYSIENKQQESEDGNANPDDSEQASSKESTDKGAEPKKSDNITINVQTLHVHSGGLHVTSKTNPTNISKRYRKKQSHKKPEEKIWEDIEEILADYISENNIGMSTDQLAQLVIERYATAEYQDRTSYCNSTSDSEAYSPRSSSSSASIISTEELMEGDTSQSPPPTSRYSSASSVSLEEALKNILPPTKRNDDSYSSSPARSVSSEVSLNVSEFSSGDEPEKEAIPMTHERPTSSRLTLFRSCSLKKFPSDETLREISENIYTTELQKFGRHLGVTQAVIPGSKSSDEAYTMLKKWRDDKMTGFTEEDIREKLCKIFDEMKKPNLKDILG